MRQQYLSLGFWTAMFSPLSDLVVSIYKETEENSGKWQFGTALLYRFDQHAYASLDVVWFICAAE